jgi:hypothetical protein
MVEKIYHLSISAIFYATTQYKMKISKCKKPFGGKIGFN